jgi:hypothetical protein
MARQTEPNPWTMCKAEQVTSEGDDGFEECESLSKQEAADDFARDMAAATEAR